MVKYTFKLFVKSGFIRNISSTVALFIYNVSSIARINMIMLKRLFIIFHF